MVAIAILPLHPDLDLQPRHPGFFVQDWPPVPTLRRNFMNLRIDRLAIVVCNWLAMDDHHFLDSRLPISVVATSVLYIYNYYPNLYTVWTVCDLLAYFPFAVAWVGVSAL